MFNSQCSILIGTEGGRTSPSGCEFNESFFELVRQGDLILHRANDSQSDIHFLMAAPYRACIRGRSSSAENCALGIEHWSDPGSDAEQWEFSAHFVFHNGVLFRPPTVPHRPGRTILKPTPGV